MVTRVSVAFILLLTVSGCCYNGKLSDYGLPRKAITKLKNSTIDYSKIDTMALYKAEAGFNINSLTKEYTYYEKDVNNSYPYVSYLKFYQDGKLGVFIIPKTDTLALQRDFFNPVKAKMGYYNMNGKVLKIRIATIGDCTLYISDSEGTIQNDTLKMLNKNYSGKIYKKVTVPKSLLEKWKPDW